MLLSAQPSAEEIGRRERFQRLLQELNLDSVAASDAVKREVFAIVTYIALHCTPRRFRAS